PSVSIPTDQCPKPEGAAGIGRRRYGSRLLLSAEQPALIGQLAVDQCTLRPARRTQPVQLKLDAGDSGGEGHRVTPGPETAVRHVLGLKRLQQSTGNACLQLVES